MTAHDGFFDSRAENWEKTWYPEPVRVRLRDLIQEFGVTTGERLLDVGTGPGVLIPYLRPLVGHAGQICAFDLSLHMVRQAYRKPRAALDIIIQADVHCIPFNNNVFDRVICFAAFPHFNDPALAVREMGRVLRSGGTIIIAHLMSRKELSMHHASHAAVARDVLPDDRQMKAYFSGANLSSPKIVDMPGRYLAKAVKQI